MATVKKEIRRENEIQKDIDKIWKKVDELIARNGAIPAKDNHWISYQLNELNAEMDKAKERSKKELQLVSYNKDEYGHEVSRYDWEKAKIEAAKPNRVYGEHRAVVQDVHIPGQPEIIYINAAAAMRAIKDYTELNRMDGERDPAKDGDKLYKACDSNGKITIGGYHWYYATPDDVQKKINREFINKNEDDYVD